MTEKEWEEYFRSNERSKKKMHAGIKRNRESREMRRSLVGLFNPLTVLIFICIIVFIVG